MKNKLCFAGIFVLMLTSCGSFSSANTSLTSVSNQDEIHINDIDCYVYQKDIFVRDNIQTDLANESYMLDYKSGDIRIENDQIIALRSETTTEVTLTTEKTKKRGKFIVTVHSHSYVSKHLNAEMKEGWFNELSASTIKPITGLKQDSNIINGMDISSCAVLYENGAQFFNEEGIEESLFYILKDHGVNSVRLRLWNNPSDGIFEYGGGNNDIKRTKWIVHELDYADIDYTLDFHYSDFWADPSKQVIPKDWQVFSTVKEYEDAIYNFTKASLEELKNVGRLPKMVQIGNEINLGILVSLPGPHQTTSTGNDPSYISGRTAQNVNLSGNSNGENFIKYLASGIKAVKDVSSSIKTIIHIAKGFSGTDYIINFYNKLASLDYDVIGLSAYSFYHFSNISILKSGLKKVSDAFPNKEILIAETSYGFTLETDNLASNIFNEEDKTANYEISITGQALIYRDTLEAILSINNGIGVYYWEGAWIPCKNCGWSDNLSKASYANQGFFSYNGKVTGSLDVFKKVYES